MTDLYQSPNIVPMNKDPRPITIVQFIELYNHADTVMVVSGDNCEIADIFFHQKFDYVDGVYGKQEISIGVHWSYTDSFGSVVRDSINILEKNLGVGTPILWIPEDKFVRLTNAKGRKVELSFLKAIEINIFEPEFNQLG